MSAPQDSVPQDLAPQEESAPMPMSFDKRTTRRLLKNVFWPVHYLKGQYKDEMEKIHYNWDDIYLSKNFTVKNTDEHGNVTYSTYARKDYRMSSNKGYGAKWTPRKIAKAASSTCQGEFGTCYSDAPMDCALKVADISKRIFKKETVKDQTGKQVSNHKWTYADAAAMPVYLNFGRFFVCLYVNGEMAFGEDGKLANTSNKKGMPHTLILALAIAKALGGEAVMNEGGYPDSIFQLITGGFALVFCLQKLTNYKLLELVFRATKTGKLMTLTSLEATKRRANNHPEILDSHTFAFREICFCEFGGVPDVLMIIKDCQCEELEGIYHLNKSMNIHLDPLTRKSLEVSLREPGTIAIRLADVPSYFQSLIICKPHLPLLPENPKESPVESEEDGHDLTIWLEEGYVDSITGEKTHEFTLCGKDPEKFCYIEVILWERFPGGRDWKCVAMHVTTGEHEEWMPFDCVKGLGHAALVCKIKQKAETHLSVTVCPEEGYQYDLAVICTYDPPEEPTLPSTHLLVYDSEEMRLKQQISLSKAINDGCSTM